MRNRIIQLLGLQCATVKSVLMTVIMLPLIAVFFPFIFIGERIEYWINTHPDSILNKPISPKIPIISEASAVCDVKFKKYEKFFWATLGASK